MFGNNEDLLYLSIQLDPLILKSQNQAKNIAMVIPSYPIKIGRGVPEV